MMKKANAYQKSFQDLSADLKKQKEALGALCKLYDNGTTVVYLPMTTLVRNLVHDGQKPSLLAALKARKTMYFSSTCRELNPRNLLTENLLCSMRISQTGAIYVPLLDKGPHKVRKLSFAEWWNAKVIKDKTNNTLSRRDIILSVANTDGGAHIDNELDEVYKNLSKDNSLAWISSTNGVAAPMEDPTPACVRQIAYELLDSLEVL